MLSRNHAAQRLSVSVAMGVIYAAHRVILYRQQMMAPPEKPSSLEADCGALETAGFDFVIVPRVVLYDRNFLSINVVVPKPVDHAPPPACMFAFKPRYLWNAFCHARIALHANLSFDWAVTVSLASVGIINVKSSVSSVVVRKFVFFVGTPPAGVVLEAKT